MITLRKPILAVSGFLKFVADFDSSELQISVYLSFIKSISRSNKKAFSVEICYGFPLCFTQVSEKRMALVTIFLTLAGEVGKCLLQKWISRQMVPSVRTQEHKTVLTVTQWSCTIKSETRSNSCLSLVVLKALLYISWFITERLDWTLIHFQVLNTKNVITKNVLVNNNLLAPVVLVNNFFLIQT